MDTDQARRIAVGAHGTERNRFGELVIEHLDRVAAAVPLDARATAWLHDVGESTEAHGLTAVETAALQLLTRTPSETYELYVLRIAHASGPEGRLARCVKLADLDDHIAHEWIPEPAPPYRWARRHIIRGQERRGESVPAARSTAA